MKNIIVSLTVFIMIMSPILAYSDGQKVDMRAIKKLAKEQIDMVYRENANIEEVRRQSDKIALIREKFNNELKTIKHKKTVNKLLDKAEKFCLNVSSKDIDGLKKQAYSFLEGVNIGIDTE